MDNLSSNLFPEIAVQNNFKDVEHDISIAQIEADFRKLYQILCPELVQLKINLDDETYAKIAAISHGDLYARVAQDPITIAPSFIYKLSRSYKVIFYYRLAHELFYVDNENEKISNLCKYYAFYISEEATKTTTIEIHPQVKIGKNFVIDHGVNTLIGATSQIGDNCTLLNNVLLGARKITFNPVGKRHPTLGNNVHVARGVQILGPVQVGSDSKIGPDCVIVNDIPEKTIVKKIVTQQISTQK
ncbi:serine O-acetyltransferase [Kordia jejudonensis]|uniref:serine O-acetyltransferase n=1 Tax=Kordia jejudonensis TaxID=1348245 RepID=UPI00069B9F1E|nr:serine acetyltransferase [Kordia jejudonensis]